MMSYSHSTPSSGPPTTRRHFLAEFLCDLSYLCIGFVLYTAGRYFSDIQPYAYPIGTCVFVLSWICSWMSISWLVYRRVAPDNAHRDKLLYQKIRAGYAPKLPLFCIIAALAFICGFFSFVSLVVYKMLVSSKEDSDVPSGRIPLYEGEALPHASGVSHVAPFAGRNGHATPFAFREIVWCIVILAILVFVSALWSLRLAAHRVLTTREGERDSDMEEGALDVESGKSATNTEGRLQEKMAMRKGGSI
ncbi:hypothetical protein BV22DRAFT_1034025 [Leucogyrophana mollusca]|uniref:Uncharacterized protein n=1 Tax=Leucogyrophana mollusca TaxID=85980 RepID=A0ACB8BJP0_9AGAM|nr:hypothetical protein BV22DRAFT_1034025 [Leucogyrophana mollusca]